MDADLVQAKGKQLAENPDHSKKMTPPSSSMPKTNNEGHGEENVLSQFSDKIMAAAYPKGLDSRGLPKYDGSQDSLNHVNNFKMEIGVKGIVGHVIP